MKFARTAALALMLGSTAAAAFDLPTSWTVRQLSLPTNDLVYDAATGHLFASVPSIAGIGRGNTITRIDPRNGSIVSSVFVGSEPGPLGLSGDGSALWVGLNGSGAVRRFNMSTQTAGQQFAVGSEPFLGTYYAEDIAVSPLDPNLVAISRRNSGFSPRHEGVALYLNGVQLPNTTPDHTGSNRIEFAASGQLIYGYNNETTEFGFRTMTVSANGVAVSTVAQNVLSGFGLDIELHDGVIYATSGRALDPQTNLLLGTYGSSGAVEADGASGYVFFLDSFGGRLTAYDLQTFVPLQTYMLPGVLGTASSLERWGTDGLAFRTSSGQVFLLNPIPEPEQWLLLGAGLVAVIVRARRPRKLAA